MAKLLTASGYQGITAQEDSDFYAGIVGTDAYIMDVGARMEASIATATTVQIADGEVVQHGRRVHIDAGEADVFEIPAGYSGATSWYIIGYRLVVNTDDTETCEPFVQKMTGSADMIETGNLREGDSEELIPLYRVTQEGASITQTERLPSVATPIRNYLEGLHDTSGVNIDRDGGGIYGWNAPNGTYNQIDSNDNTHTWIRDSAQGTLTGYVRWARGSQIDLNRMTDDIAAANNSVNQAQAAANEAKTEASSAKSVANEAKSTATAASSTAAAAQKTADGLNSKIESATSTANSASSTASAAAKTATTANNTANTAKTTAEAAQKTANAAAKATDLTTTNNNVAAVKKTADAATTNISAINTTLNNLRRIAIGSKVVTLTEYGLARLFTNNEISSILGVIVGDIRKVMVVAMNSNFGANPGVIIGVVYNASVESWDIYVQGGSAVGMQVNYAIFMSN